MIKVTPGKNKFDIECSCGNKKGDKFGKYLYNKVVEGERKRKIVIKREGLACLQCKRVLLTQSQLEQQLNDSKRSFGKDWWKTD